MIYNYAKLTYNQRRLLQTSKRINFHRKEMYLQKKHEHIYILKSRAWRSIERPELLADEQGVQSSKTLILTFCEMYDSGKIAASIVRLLYSL